MVLSPPNTNVYQLSSNIDALQDQVKGLELSNGVLKAQVARLRKENERNRRLIEAFRAEDSRRQELLGELQ